MRLTKVPSMAFPPLSEDAAAHPLPLRGLKGPRRESITDKPPHTERFAVLPAFRATVARRSSVGRQNNGVAGLSVLALMHRGSMEGDHGEDGASDPWRHLRCLAGAEPRLAGNLPARRLLSCDPHSSRPPPPGWNPL